MKRVTGLGGIFFKAENPEKLYAWYEKHLGLQRQAWRLIQGARSTITVASPGSWIPKAIALNSGNHPRSDE
jgi:hypothetical protein